MQFLINQSAMKIKKISTEEKLTSELKSFYNLPILLCCYWTYIWIYFRYIFILIRKMFTNVHKHIGI